MTARLLPPLLVIASLMLTASSPIPDPPDASFGGTWVLDSDLSTAIDPWQNLSVEIEMDGDAVVLQRNWRGSREGGAFADSVRLVPGTTVQSEPMLQWPDERHLGAYIAGDRRKSVASRWADDGQTLITESTLTLSIQQGEQPIRIYTEYRLSPEGDRLDVLELRSTRPRPIHYVFTRADA